MKRLSLLLFLAMLLIPIPAWADLFPLGATWSSTFSTYDSNNALVDADSTPTCTSYIGSSNTPITTGTVTKISTGFYRCQIVMSAGNGFAAGSSYSNDADATVATLSQKKTMQDGIYLLATPATVGVIPVDTVRINNVPATPVTTIKAVLGLAIDGVMPTVTNLTNAPTVGDLTAAMKASVTTAATVATPVAASVTGNVGGNLLGNVTGTTGGMTAAGIASTFFTTNSTKTYPDAVGGSPVKETADNSAVGASQTLVTGTADSGSTTTMVDAARTEADTDYWKGRIICFTSGTINGQCAWIEAFNPATDTMTFRPAFTQAVGTQNYSIYASVSAWDSTSASHNTAGTTGATLNAAGSAGDAGTDVCPGAYAVGSLCYLIGNNLNTTVSSRSSQATMDTANAGIATTVTKTAGLTYSTANQVNANIFQVQNNAITGASVAAGAIGAAQAPNLDAAVSTRGTFSVKKATAFLWMMKFLDAAGNPVTVGTPVCTRAIDSSTVFNPTTNAPSVVSGGGRSLIQISTTDMNGNSFTDLFCTLAGRTYEYEFKIEQP